MADEITFSNRIAVLWYKWQMFFKFCLASISAALLDIGLFALFFYFLFDNSGVIEIAGYEIDGRIILSYAVARLISSAWNFIVNRYMVFRPEEGKRNSLWLELYKYYLLALAVLAVSAGGSHVLAKMLPETFAVAVKAVVDILIFLAVYVIQKVFIFKTGVSDNT